LYSLFIYWRIKRRFWGEYLLQWRFLSTFTLAGFHEKRASIAWNLGTNSAFAEGMRKTTETLVELAGCRSFRMHTDLQPAVQHSNTLYVSRCILTYSQQSSIRIHCMYPDAYWLTASSPAFEYTVCIRRQSLNVQLLYFNFLTLHSFCLQRRYLNRNSAPGKCWNYITRGPADI
jgi:hypothetical protein